VGIERAAVHVVVISPNDFEEIVTVLSFTGALAEVEEELKLGRSEGKGLFVEVKSEAVFIKAEGAEGEDDGAGTGAISL